jgi:hypothetical protein
MRVYAQLPSGEHLVPGAHALCPGPDAFGACPVADLPSGRPCAGATWHYNSAERGWHFEFASGSSVCPAAVLDPLGPIAVPLD